MSSRACWSATSTGAYNVIPGLPHQRCWTHLLRDIHQLKERLPEHEGLALFPRGCGKC